MHKGEGESGRRLPAIPSSQTEIIASLRKTISQLQDDNQRLLKNVTTLQRSLARHNSPAVSKEFPPHVNSHKEVQLPNSCLSRDHTTSDEAYRSATKNVNAFFNHNAIVEVENRRLKNEIFELKQKLEQLAPARNIDKAPLYNAIDETRTITDERAKLQNDEIASLTVLNTQLQQALDSARQENNALKRESEKQIRSIASKTFVDNDRMKLIAAGLIQILSSLESYIKFLQELPTNNNRVSPLSDRTRDLHEHVTQRLNGFAQYIHNTDTDTQTSTGEILLDTYTAQVWTQREYIYTFMPYFANVFQLFDSTKETALKAYKNLSVLQSEFTAFIQCNRHNIHFSATTRNASFTGKEHPPQTTAAESLAPVQESHYPGEENQAVKFISTLKQIEKQLQIQNATSF